MSDPRHLIETAASRARPSRRRPEESVEPTSTDAPMPAAEEDVNAPYGLRSAERAWQLLDKPLQRTGYRLRPRYRTGWVGSWVGTKKKAESCEDSIRMGHVPVIMDAVRISDGAQVLLKMWNDNERDGPELHALRYFSHSSRINDPCNHCVPLLDCFTFPGAQRFFKAMLVEPLLRDWRYPPFLMVAEALSFMLQAIEGLEYMHSHSFFHGDIHSGNIMMDPKDMFPKGFHGAFNWSFRARAREKRGPSRTRLQVPVKYYWIDFGSSRQLEGENRLVAPGWAAWRAPEMDGESENLFDPFKADVYALGLTLLTEIQRRTRLDFVIPTLIGMIAENPNDRPTMAEVKLAFKSLLAGLTPRQLRTRIGWSDDDSFYIRPMDRMVYIRLLWHSYRYGLPKDVRSKPKAPWWKLYPRH
ncbi:kinase-like protein [Calocera viscosa TUFC12733]|uniref:Kinase-like protein n=1 Tax=Calocera viscosa (strain TUFC12733) TaxID=1330018 RepID=A0A167KVK9_CALVF|nr:kinase-like protein [Calocera viscosa TUFC12733]